MITPGDSTAVAVTSDVYHGGVLFDASSPLTDASGTIPLTIPAYYHSLNFFGHSSNVTVGLLYTVGSFQALMIFPARSFFRRDL